MDWEQLSWPIALPYFGVETVTSSSNVIKDLRAVLRSAFSIVTVREVQQQLGGCWKSHDKLYAVRSNTHDARMLSPRTQLLQVQTDSEHSCLLIADEARRLLSLTGEYGELMFERLCKYKGSNNSLETVRGRPIWCKPAHTAHGWPPCMPAHG